MDKNNVATKAKDLREQWVKSIPIDNMVVADVGCGPREKWIDKRASGTPIEITGIDYQDFGENIKASIEHRETIKNLRGYDVVCAIEVFEHLFDPVVAIENVRYMLKPGGIFYFSNPVINPVHDTVDYLRIMPEWWERAFEEMPFQSWAVHKRHAIAGAKHLREFYKAEHMRISKIRLPDQAHDLALCGVHGWARKKDEL